MPAKRPSWRSPNSSRSTSTASTTQSMARLGEHYSPAEVVAIMFRLAFADGFTKLRRVLDLPPNPVHPMI